MFGNPSLSFNTYNLLLSIFVALGTLSTAYGLAIIGSTVGQPNCEADLRILLTNKVMTKVTVYTYFSLEAGTPYTSKLIGALNGSNSGGAFLGCIFSAWSADFFGRKRTMQIGCGILVIGGALNAGSVSITMFAIGRAVAGVGSGILAIVVPMYQGEVATAETRGAMMCITGVMYAWGYALAGWLGYACNFISADSAHSSAAWWVTVAYSFPQFELS